MMHSIEVLVFCWDYHMKLKNPAMSLTRGEVFSSQNIFGENILHDFWVDAVVYTHTLIQTYITTLFP